MRTLQARGSCMRLPFLRSLAFTCALTLPASSGFAQQPSDAAALRAEVTRLRGELDALEARLTALEGMASLQVLLRLNRRPRRRPWTAERGVFEGVQPGHVCAREFRGRCRQESGERPAFVAADRSRGGVSGCGRSLRARGFLSVGRPRRARSGRRLRHVYCAPGKSAAEGRQDARAVRQGEYASHPRDADRGSAAGHGKPRRRRRGHFRQRGSRCRG